MQSFMSGAFNRFEEEMQPVEVREAILVESDRLVNGPRTADCYGFTVRSPQATVEKGPLSLEETNTFSSSAESGPVADLPIGARSGLLHHSGTANE